MVHDSHHLWAGACQEMCVPETRRMSLGDMD